MSETTLDLAQLSGLELLRTAMTTPDRPPFKPPPQLRPLRHRHLRPPPPPPPKRPPPRGRAASSWASYRYWPVLDSVSIARLALAFLPVTRVRM